MDTDRGISHTGTCCGGGRARGQKAGDWRGITLGEIPNVGDKGIKAANHHSMCIPM